MSTKIKKTPLSYTATAARANFYSVLKEASATYNAYEVTQRNAEPVVIINKQKYLEMLNYIPQTERHKFEKPTVPKKATEKPVKYPETKKLVDKWTKIIAKRTKGRPLPDYIFDRERMYDEDARERGLM